MGKDLFTAAQTGDLAKLEALLSNKGKSKTLGPLASLLRGPNVNSQDSSGNTPLHLAALNGKREAVELLLQADASANVPDNQGNYPLHLAAFNGHDEVIKVLLCRGPSRASVNEQNMNGDTALHVGSQYGHSAAVRALVEHHADARIRNNKWESALDLAATYGKLITVQMLVLSNPGVLLDHPDDHSPLHLAARNGHATVMEFLLDRGLSVNEMCSSGTPLHDAALYGKTDVVRLLLQRGADVKAKNPNGETVLDLMEKIPSQRSQDITALIYEQSNPVGDPNMRTKSLTFSGKHNILSPGGAGGTLPSQQKRPGLPDFRASTEVHANTEQNPIRGPSISTIPRDKLNHEYHILTYPRVDHTATDYSLASVSPLSRSPDKVDIFDYAMNDSCRKTGLENDSDKENIPQKQQEVAPRHSSPAVFGRAEDDSAKPNAGEKRHASVGLAGSIDRAAASYDFVPIRQPKETTAFESGGAPQVCGSYPRQSSLNYDIVQPHPRKADQQLNCMSGNVEKLTVRTSGGESHEYLRLTAPGQRKGTVDSNSSDEYNDLVLEEKNKFDSLGGRYQKLSYSSEKPTEERESVGDWEEYQGYKVFAPPGLLETAKSSPDASVSQSNPVTKDQLMGHPKFPPASQEGVYHLLGAKEDLRSLPPGPPKSESTEKKSLGPPQVSTGVYCILGDGWGQPERRVDPPPVYETPPLRTVQKSPKTQKRMNSPTRVAMQEQSHSMFYEVPPIRTSPSATRRSDLPVYETPPMRILPKDQPVNVSPQGWVKFDHDQSSERPLSRVLGSSMFYTGSAAAVTASEHEQETSASLISTNLSAGGSPGEVITQASTSANFYVDTSEDKGDKITGEVNPRKWDDGGLVTDKTSKRNSEPGEAAEVEKSQASIEQEQAVDSTDDVSRTAEETANAMETTPENLSPFRTLHENFNPEAKVSKQVTASMDFYDNVNITNKRVDTAKNSEPEGQSDPQSLTVEFSTESKTLSQSPPVDVYENVGRLSEARPLTTKHRAADLEVSTNLAEETNVIVEDQVLPGTTAVTKTVASSAGTTGTTNTIKSSGIKQKRSSSKIETGTETESSRELVESEKAASRLSSLPEDLAFNEMYEWTKIDRFLESLEEMAGQDILPGNKIISQESVEAFLSSLGISQYEVTFVANGYDDINFIGGIIVEAQDLCEIGIQKEEHIGLLLEAIKTLPEPPQMGSDEFPIPATVGDWLRKINLPDYEAKFIRCGYDSVDRVRLVWEFELLTVIDINVTGHRKRMAHSLGNWQRSPQTQPQKTWAEKFKEAEDKKHGGRASDSFLDDSMDIANQLLHTAEDLANEMAKRKAQGTREPPGVTEAQVSSEEKAEPAVVVPPRESYVRTVGEQSMTNFMAESPPRNLGQAARPALEYKPHFNASWRHKPETLLYEGVRYRTKYLGSHQVTQVRGTSSTLEACQKMMGSSKMLEKIPEIQLGISVRGIDYIDMQSKNVISSYDIRNISYCAQYPNDLTIFAYITKDTVTRRHYCHVFRSFSMVQADEIILTIGQCFELAYEQHRLLVESAQNGSHKEAVAVEVAGNGNETGAAMKGPPPIPAPFAETMRTKDGEH